MSQFVDLGISRKYLEEYLCEIGYWNTAEKCVRYGYVLSPCAYTISRQQEERLNALSRVVYDAITQLSGELSMLAKKQAGFSDIEARFLARARRASRSLLLPDTIEGAVPPALKIDLVQGMCGRYFIAEIDSYNPRGFGYLAFLDGTLPCESPRLGLGLGHLAQLLRESAACEDALWHLIVSEYELYYQPSFQILAKALGAYGIRFDVVMAKDLASDCFTNASRQNPMHVFMIPDTMDHEPLIRDKLVDLYKGRALRTLYPPAAYLGSKAFLPYLARQKGMGGPGFIPPCSLVSRSDNPWNRVSSQEPFVLKGVMSSGAKKIVFSDGDPARLWETLKVAFAAKQPQWIIQRQVEQRALPVIVFDEHGDHIENEYYLRITAYVTAEGLLGAEVTGRTDKMVHGAPDCIQLPIVRS